MTMLNPQTTSIMLLAAGRGTRMAPLTDHMPKPLLKVGSHSLIEHHLYRLQDQGFKHVVINTAYLGSQIQSALGDGERYGLTINYSDESDTGALETAGGIKKSLALIQSNAFISINADVFTDYNFATLLGAQSSQLGTLVLVENPDHNPNGDFEVSEARDNGPLEKPLAEEIKTRRMTYSGIALYKKRLFKELPEGKLALGPILKKHVSNGELSTIAYKGSWTDVGTPERLHQLNHKLNQT